MFVFLRGMRRRGEVPREWWRRIDGRRWRRRRRGGGVEAGEWCRRWEAAGGEKVREEAARAERSHRGIVE